MNSDKYSQSKGWKIIYKVFPPFVRILEKLKFHTGRQPFPIGFLNKEKYSEDDFKNHLINEGFEIALLAWKDEGEILSLRKIDNTIFQYHIRLHSDGEIRAHYEYSTESNPIKHFFEKDFDPKNDYFTNLLKDYLR